MKIKREEFFSQYRNEFSCYRGSFGTLTDSQLIALNIIFDNVAKDDKLTDYRHLAYMLATTKHETASTYRPIEEIGHGQGRLYGIPDQVTGKIYFGRGYVQLTWKENYATFSKILGIDLINNPDLVMDFDVAYHIMSHGMRKGTFTGVGLSRYINDERCDYISARKIINGKDCCEKIANYAVIFDRILSKTIED